MQLTLQLQELIKELINAQLDHNVAESDYLYAIGAPGYDSDCEFTDKQKDDANFEYEMTANALSNLNNKLIHMIKREFMTEEVMYAHTEKQYQQAA